MFIFFKRGNALWLKPLESVFFLIDSFFKWKRELDRYHSKLTILLRSRTQSGYIKSFNLMVAIKPNN